MANEPKKSKYFKSENDKPTSKYIKAQGEQKKSKYIKTDADRNAEIEKRANRYASSTSYRKNAASTNLSNRTARAESKTENRADTKSAAKTEEKKTNMPQEVTSLDEVREHKGDHTSIFTNEKADRQALKNYIEAEETPDDNRRATQLIRNGLIIFGLLVVSILINFIVINQHGEIKFMPTFLTMEFSAIPEFIATLAFGPVVGVAIVLVKNVFHMLVYQGSFVSEISNFILDSFFIFLSGWIYTRRMFNFKPPKNRNLNTSRDIRTRRIMIAGFAGTIATSIATFFTTRFFAFPVIVRVYSPRGPEYSDMAILTSYQDALERIRAAAPAIGKLIPDIGTSFTRAVLTFNVPLTFIKFAFITVIVALLYPPISDFLHYRVKSKTKRR